MAQRWEYSISSIAVGAPWEQMQAELNEHGQAGWELVSVVYHASFEYILMAFWRRQISES